MSLSQRVRRTARQGTFLPATVLDQGGGKATVRLSGNGAILRMLPIVGGPVKIDQQVHVDYSTDVPTVVAPGVAAPEDKEPRTRTYRPVRSMVAPEEVSAIILVHDAGGGEGGDPDLEPPANPPPEGIYEVTVAGLEDAISSASYGSVIYVPECELGTSTGSGNGFSSGSEAIIDFPPGVTIIGAGKTKTIIARGFTVDNDAVFRNLAIRMSESVTNYLYGMAMVGERMTLMDTVIDITTSTTATTFCFTNMFHGRLNASNAEFYAANSNNTAKGIVAAVNGGDEQLGADEPWSVFYWYSPAPLPPDNTSLYWGGDRVELRWEATTIYEVDHWAYEGIGVLVGFHPNSDWENAQNIRMKFICTQGGLSNSGSPPVMAIEDVSYYTGWSGSPAPGWYENPIDVADEQQMDLPFNLYHADVLYLPNSGNITSGSTEFFCFFVTRYSDYANQATQIYLKLWEVYLTKSDGTKVYLYPYRFYCYLDYCTIDAESTDVDMANFGYAELYACNLNDWDGEVVFKTNPNDIPILFQDNEPDVTYPGMWWIDTDT